MRQIQAIFQTLNHLFFNSTPIEMTLGMLTSQKVLVSVPLNNGIFLVFSTWQKCLAVSIEITSSSHQSNQFYDNLQYFHWRKKGAGFESL